jgi:hypothetical protein
VQRAADVMRTCPLVDIQSRVACWFVALALALASAAKLAHHPLGLAVQRDVANA